MDCSTPDFPVFHCLLEFAQTRSMSGLIRHYCHCISLRIGYMFSKSLARIMLLPLQCLDWSINSYRQIVEWWLTDSKILAELKVRFSSVQLLSHVQLLVTPWTTAHQVSLSITNSRSLLKLMSIELVMPSNHLILCSPLFLRPSILSIIRVFSSESVLCIRWPKHWSVSFNISPSKEYSGLISSEMNWLDLLAVQGTQESSPTP